MSLSDFYTSKGWRDFRRYYIQERIARDGALYDDYDGHQILNDYDVILHHKTYLTEMNVGDPEISLNPDNIMLVTHRNHNVIHQRYGHGRRAVYLVWGAPKSGKSYWVDMNKSPEDLVCDMGRIYECLGSNGITPRFSSSAFKVQETILDIIKTRYGKWGNAYIIGTYPRDYDRKMILGTYRAEEVFIDTSMDICMERCRTKEEMEYVRKWFSERS